MMIPNIWKFQKCSKPPTRLWLCSQIPGKLDRRRLCVRGKSHRKKQTPRCMWQDPGMTLAQSKWGIHMGSTLSNIHQLVDFFNDLWSLHGPWVRIGLLNAPREGMVFITNARVLIGFVLYRFYLKQILRPKQSDKSAKMLVHVASVKFNR